MAPRLTVRPVPRAGRRGARTLADAGRPARNTVTRSSDTVRNGVTVDGGRGVEWIVAVGAFLLISVVVIGLPMYLVATRWSTRSERMAAEARRRASAHASASVPAQRSGVGRRRKVLSGS